jgi:pimeloyl-ACP methyl ester carboxylesterase
LPRNLYPHSSNQSMPTIESQKLKIAYQSQTLEIEYFFRPGPKETVLYLHGLGCSKNDFLDACDKNSLYAHSLIAFDFPGHGGSNYPNRPLNIDDLVEITHLVVVKLDLHGITLIGHSMGGLVGLLYAEKYPKNIKAFINVEGNLTSEDCFFSRQITQVDFETFRQKTFHDFKTKLQKSENVGFQKYAETLEKFQPIKAMHDYSPSIVQYSESGTLIQKFLSLEMPQFFIYGSENSHSSSILELKQQFDHCWEFLGNHFPQYDFPLEFYRYLGILLNE